MQKDQIMISICIKIIKNLKFYLNSNLFCLFNFFPQLVLVRTFSLFNAVISFFFHFGEMKYFRVTNYFKCKFLFFLMSIPVKYSALYQTICITFFFFHSRILSSGVRKIREKIWIKLWFQYASCYMYSKKEQEDGKEKCNQRKGIKWDFKSNMYHFVTVALFCCRCCFSFHFDAIAKRTHSFFSWCSVSIFKFT